MKGKVSLSYIASILFKNISRREVPQEKASWFAEKNNLLFFETSAKTGNNVEDVNFYNFELFLL